MHRSQATIPKNTFTSNRNTETWAYKLNENAHNADVLGDYSLDVWNMNSDQTEQCKDIIRGGTKYI